jgi:hypothetical protein
MAIVETAMKYVPFDVLTVIAYRLRTEISLHRYQLLHMLPNRRPLAKMRGLRGTKVGREAFVLANGPSLGKLDPNKVRRLQQEGRDVFAVNHYITSEFGKIVPPDCYVLSDPAFFDVRDNDISEELRSSIDASVRALQEANVQVFVPAQFFRKWRGPDAYPFCDSENLFSGNAGEPTAPRGYVSMTAYKALSVACFLGYEKIYIGGFDNDYFRSLVVDRENQPSFTDSHFYGAAKPIRARNESVGDLLWSYYMLFVGIEKFRRFPIVNLDPDGLVDAFPKSHSLDVY